MRSHGAIFCSGIVVSLGVASCDPGPQPGETNHREAGSYVLTLDPASGTATFATQQQAVYVEVPFGEDGNPGTNPPGTMQAVTTSALLPGDPGCPTDNCFTVQLTNFSGTDLTGVFMSIDAITPPTGRALVGSDGVPAGVTAPGGGRNFGNLTNGQTSAGLAFNISIPDLTPYTVRGRFWGDDGTVGGGSATRSYPGPTVSVDATTTDVGTVTFLAGDFPPGTTISDVNITIDFHKTDGTCAAPAGGNAFHNETGFSLVSAQGTVIPLSPPGTWSGGTDTPPVTVTFDQAAAAIPSGTPVDGTFLPNTGNLNDLNGESPVGNWTLRSTDTAGADPLCVLSYSITVETL